MRHLRSSLMASCVLVSACGGSTNGADGLTTLVEITVEAAGANCADGGQRIDVGIDDSGDGLLDDAEIDSTAYVCNGATGTDGAATLFTATDEAAGANCAEGGQRIDAGLDDNGDGVLDAGEVDATMYVCNGEQGSSGAATLVAVTDEPAGANCAGGGQRIDAGVDDSGDGVLDAGEIDATSYVCDGAEGPATLVLVTDEAAGANCAEGGQRIDAGIDDDGDGTLDAGEIDSTSYACDGEDGLGSLVEVTDEPEGANCAEGGQRIDAGLDDDGDGTLDAGEIDSTAYACNGSGSATPIAKYLYLANWAGISTSFSIYDLATDAWTTGKTLPVSSRGQLASTGTRVRMLGTDNYVYEYDVMTDAWTRLMQGPAGFDSLAFFEIANGKMYLCEAGSSTLHVYRAGAWFTATLSTGCSIAGGTDPAANEVYIKTYDEMGFMVVDAETDTLARTITDTTSTGENTSSGAFLDGDFYVRYYDGNVFALAGGDGTKIDTGVDPLGTWDAFYADPYAGRLYIHSQDSFGYYDPATGTLTPLVTGPTESTLGTIVLTY